MQGSHRAAARAEGGKWPADGEPSRGACLQRRLPMWRLAIRRRSQCGLQSRVPRCSPASWAVAAPLGPVLLSSSDQFPLAKRRHECPSRQTCHARPSASRRCLRRRCLLPQLPPHWPQSMGCLQQSKNGCKHGSGVASLPHRPNRAVRQLKGWVGQRRGVVGGLGVQDLRCCAFRCCCLGVVAACCLHYGCSKRGYQEGLRGSREPPTASTLLFTAWREQASLAARARWPPPHVAEAGRRLSPMAAGHPGRCGAL